MAGTYTKKDFGVGAEEQTLLKDSNGTRIVPAKGNGNVFSHAFFSLLSWPCGNAALILFSESLPSLFPCFIFLSCIPAQTSL